jgi:hypothetical protein
MGYKVGAGAQDFYILGENSSSKKYVLDGVVGSNKGLSQLKENITTPANGSVAYITSKYNTGYMTGDIRGAWNVDTDVTSLGTELVTNGAFRSTDRLASHTYNNGDATFTLTEDSNAGTTDGYVWIYLNPPTIGRFYTVEIQCDAAFTATGNTRLDSVTAPTAVFSDQGTTNLRSLTFKHTNSQAGVILYSSPVSGSTVTYTVSIKEAIPDRSVKGKGLAVHGTPTVSAVATGAELKCISGFSSSNYVQQPYNSDLDFGTGDFSFSVWAKSPVSGSAEYLMDRADSDGSNRSGFYISGTSLVGYYSSGNVSKTVGLPVNWTHFAMARSGTTTSLYVNGVSIGSGTGGGSENLTGDGTASFKLGARYTNSEHWQGSLALPRWSATAPTAEQIKEIYEAEKPLFQDNAKCTLNGTSDAVTAMSYDDSNEELLVGTSGGLSVFKGLRRVDENTNNITEVAQQGGLRVEEY